VKSATTIKNEIVRRMQSFNPRAREERDFGESAQTRRYFRFNPRAREERDDDSGSTSDL